MRIGIIEAGAHINDLVTYDVESFSKEEIMPIIERDYFFGDELDEHDDEGVAVRDTFEIHDKIAQIVKCPVEGGLYYIFLLEE